MCDLLYISLEKRFFPPLFHCAALRSPEGESKRNLNRNQFFYSTFRLKIATDAFNG